MDSMGRQSPQTALAAAVAILTPRLTQPSSHLSVLLAASPSPVWGMRETSPVLLGDVSGKSSISEQQEKN